MIGIQPNIFIASFKHETNTYSAVPTPVSRFHVEGRLLTGAEAIAYFAGTDSVVGGMLDTVTGNGATVTLPIAANGWPSGYVHDNAFETIADLICDALQGARWDGILLDLHGAMATESYPDGEAELLRRIRDIAPSVPLGLALDMHANVSPEMVGAVDVLCGYQTYPHLDERETGVRTARLLLATIDGTISPALAWGAVPMLPHVMAQSSYDEPNRSLQNRCVELAGVDALDCSLFTGFPHSDVPNAGLSAVVMTDADPCRAAMRRDELLEEAWAQRKAFEFSVEPLADSVRRAKTLANSGSVSGPIFLLDHYDNAASGGSMAEIAVLAELIRQGLRDVVFFALWAPEAVAVAHRAGLGQRVTISLSSPSSMSSEMLEFEGEVTHLSDGLVKATHSDHTGLLLELGDSALVKGDGIDLVLVSLPMEPSDMACFELFGVDPRERKFVVLKSRVHWRAAFESMVGAVIPCAGIGACTSDYSELEFTSVRRPIFPLERDAKFMPVLLEKNFSGAAL